MKTTYRNPSILFLCADDAPPLDGGCRVVLIINIYYLYLNFIIMVSLKTFWNLPSIYISLLLQPYVGLVFEVNY